jgi:hypothetical protein
MLGSVFTLLRSAEAGTGIWMRGLQERSRSSTRPGRRAAWGLSMPPEISRVIAKIHEAGLAHEAWPGALKSLTDALGVAGAAYIVSNKRHSVSIGPVSPG